MEWEPVRIDSNQSRHPTVLHRKTPDPARYGASLVLATCLSGRGTSLFLIDPPDDEDDKHKRHFSGEEVSQRTGDRHWKIANIEALEKRNRVGKAAQLLQWAGQYHEAVGVLEQIEPLQSATVLPDLPTEVREIAGTQYRGARLPLFPELSPQLTVFLGVDQDLLAAAERQGEAPFQLSHQAADRSRTALTRTTPAESVSLDGTCMRIEGLPA